MMHRPRQLESLPCLLASACGVLFAFAAAAPAADVPQQQLEFFEKKVRPVLAEHCYKCHAAEAKKLKASLRLDSRDAMLKGGDTGPAISPGEPEKSLLIEAVGYANIDLQMPPRSKLPDAAIEDLKAWVKMGAPWPDEAGSGGRAVKEFDLEARKASHWSWQPVKDVNPPGVKDAAWPRNAIDRFILARLEQSGLNPAPPADKRTLIRRAYYDLIGLPPTPAEVEAFVNDKSPDAYAKVVDHLLASPHFGEKWARHWMDLVRFAETHGHEFDYPIPNAWRYRDYLIGALNDDVPYNQLALEHIAGDLLPPDEQRIHPSEGWNESAIGAAFWWFGEATHAPVDVRGDEADRIDNQLDVFAKTFLGLTIACARCHDHKFDAISTKDYYALTGFLQSSRRHEVMLDPQGRIAQSVQQMKAIHARADELLRAGVAKPQAADVQTYTRYLLAARAVSVNGASVDDAAREAEVDAPLLKRWVDALSQDGVKQIEHPLFAWSQIASHKDADDPQQFAALRKRVAGIVKGRQTQADAAADEAPTFADFSSGDWNGWFTDGQAFGDGPTRAGQWAGDDQPRALEPGVAHSGAISHKLQGVLRSPTFTITHNNVHVLMNGRGAEVRLVIDGYFMQHFSGLLFNGTRQDNVDTKGEYKWVSLGGDTARYKGHTAWLEITDHGDGFAAIDRVCFSDGGPPKQPPSAALTHLLDNDHIDSLDRLAHAYGKLLADAAIKRQRGERLSNDTDQPALLTWAINHDLLPPSDDAGAAHKQLADLAAQKQKLEQQLPAPVRVLGMADGTGENGLVHIRGRHTNLGDEVPRRLLEAIDGRAIAPTDGSGRLALARKVADPANPFTSRVMVNRLWHHLFGRGIVPTVDDFGVMGQPPSHPELLDWLAKDFVSNGWSTKRAIRQMVLSQTYRMSSNPDAPDGVTNQKTAIKNQKSLDPTNNLLHRMRIRRLPAEAIRDGVLAVSGRLDRTVGGPSVPVHLTPFMEGRGRPGRSGPIDGDGRRSLYIEIRRNFLSPMLLTFDFPSPFSAMGRRTVSNVPAQALIMMNDPLVVQQAQFWAKRELDAGGDAVARIERMYVTAFTRPPTPHELAMMRAFIAEQAAAYNASMDDPRVWADVAHVMFNMKEFLFLN